MIDRAGRGGGGRDTAVGKSTGLPALTIARAAASYHILHNTLPYLVRELSMHIVRTENPNLHFCYAGLFMTALL